MGKLVHIIISILFSVAILGHSDAIITENRFPIIQLGLEKVTQLQFYVQDLFSAPNPSNVVVASAPSSSSSPTLFGLVAVLDDPVRVRPDPDAEILGRAQGIFNYASLEEIRLHMSFDIVFTGGQYNGSMLNVMGNNPYLRERRDLSVVGGSGAFKMARGFIGVRTMSLNASTGDAFFEYNVTVFHY
ncbi:hypothetical protein ACS0TY_003946 [Phlomoides rotata]